MEFRLLGVLEVSDGARLVSVGTIKYKALLAILLLRANDVVSTDCLVDELWGGSPPASATATLRGYVSGLRHALEPGSKAGSHQMVKTRPSGYLLAVAPEQIDVARFEMLVREGCGQLRQEQWGPAVTSFEQALALWRGPPLSDFVYQSFAQVEAARLREVRLSAEEGRMTAALALGNHHEVVAQLGDLAAKAPLQERLWELLILALYRCGRQGDALRTYERLRRRLGEELGIEPTSRLRRLESSILVQDAELAWQPRVPAADQRRTTESFSLPQMLATEDRTVFVGRRDEAELFRRLWSTARAGGRQVLFLSGEAGIGKSRLAAEMAREAHAGGATVLYGRCDEELLVPHQPFMEALGHYVAESDPAETERHLGANGVELTQLLPHLRRQFPELPEPTPTQPETERYRLFDAVTEFLAHIATLAPLLLVLDDLHWADKATLLLLRHLLVRGPTDIAMLVLAIHRGDEPGATGCLAEVMADVQLLNRHPLDRISLGGLSEDDIAGVLEGTGRFARGAERLAVAQSIRRGTDGNALLVEEIVHHVGEDGALHEHPGLGRRTLDGVSAMGSAEGVRQVVTRRLSRLAPTTRHALAVAAVLGAQFDLDVVEHACGLEEEELLGGIEEAMSARLVTELPDSANRYSFCHAVVRDSIYSGLTRGRRCRLHRRVAGALEDIGTDGHDGGLAAIAFHLCKAGSAADAAKAIDFARRAAEQAVAQVGYEQAAQHYLDALEATGRLPTVDLDLRCELLLSLGDAQNKGGELSGAKGVFLQAADVARQLPDPERLGRAALGYGGPVPIAAYVDDPVTVELVEEALRALGGHDSACRALLLGRLAQWRYRSGSRQERMSLCREAVDIARRLDDPKVLACVLSDRNWALLGPDDLEDRIAAAKEIVELGEGLGNDELVLQGTQSLVHSYFELGDRGPLERARQARDRLAEELRQPHYLWPSIVSGASDAIIDGRFADAGVLVERAVASRYQADPRQASNVYLAQQFVLSWLQGRLGEQADALTDLAQHYPAETVRRTRGGWCLAEIGRLDEARAEIERLSSDTLAGMPRDLDFYPVVVGASIVSLRLDDARLASTLYDVLAPFAGRNCVVGQSAFLGAAGHYLGLLAHVLGRPETAVAHLEAALARHEEMGARPFVALSQHALAAALRTLDGHGHAARAEQLTLAAFVTATQLGMGALVNETSPPTGRVGHRQARSFRAG